MSKLVLVLATRNRGKQREFTALFRKAPLGLRKLSHFKNIPDFNEEGTSFEEIATTKARAVSRELGLPALADDSGLVVKALGGAPGIFSARYAGETANDYQNNKKLLEDMRGKADRRAAFVCCIAIAKPEGAVMTFRGECCGIILHEPQGIDGFRYDPLFYYPPLNRTFAQLTAEEKNKVSHRAKATRKLRTDLQNVLNWLKK
jgi:XTP/dITP diphosphohydrolase